MDPESRTYQGYYSISQSDQQGLPMKVRKATAKDVPEIIECSKEFHTCGTALFNENERKLFKFKKNHISILKKFLEKWIRSRNARVFVAEVDKEIIGFMIMTTNKLASVYEHRKEIHIEGIFIRELFRKKGIGKMFIKEAERWAKEKGIYSLGLTVLVRNKNAFSAYKKLGFFAHNYKMSKIVK
jgi:aminoglycoside 6'-N-acetyltransferase I